MDIFAITPEELSAERRWWRAMGYAGGAPELIARHGLEKQFHETYQQKPGEYFGSNPEFAFDPTLFDEFTAHLKSTNPALPMLGAPASKTLQEAAARVWRDLGVPGPLEYFVQAGLDHDLQEALGGWEPQAVLRAFPEHKDGVVLSAILWWHLSLRVQDHNAEKAAALRPIEPLVHQFEVECALSASQVQASLRQAH